MPAWGKVRIANGGDIIQTANSYGNRETLRDRSYVRVSYFSFTP